MTQAERLALPIQIGSVSITVGEAMELRRELTDAKPWMADNIHEANVLWNLIIRAQKRANGVPLTKLPFSPVVVPAMQRLERRLSAQDVRVAA